MRDLQDPSRGGSPTTTPRPKNAYLAARDEVGLDEAVASQGQEVAGSVDVEGMVHRVIAGHLV
jgi:hypothetical protein